MRYFARPLASLVVAALAAGCATVPRTGVVSGARLGLTKAPGTLPRGVVQLEAGYSRAELDGRTRQAFGETLLRAGLGANTELRVGMPSYLRNVTTADTLTGMGDAYLAVRHRFTDARGWVPAFSVQAGSTLPTAEDRMGPGQAQPELAGYAMWRLPEKVQLLTMGVHRDAIAAGDRYGLNTVSAGLRRDVVTGVTAQADYGVVSSTRAGAADTHHLRAGAAVRIGRDLQLDGWGGRAETAGKHEYQFGLGFSRRW
jgi:hypothetical protein